MRHIRLAARRTNHDRTDVYDLLRKGRQSHDAQLLPGDVIYIPPAGPQVAIVGSVHEPGIYELRDKTTVSEALKEAGGLPFWPPLIARSSNGSRIEDCVDVDEFALDAPGLGRTLKDGDLLKISAISSRFENES